MKIQSSPRGVSLLAILLLAAFFARPAAASFHLVQIDQIFSDASGNVQYIRLSPLSGGQQFLGGQNIVASLGAVSRTFPFPQNLPGDTTGKKVLIATQGFANLNIVTPDYIVPNGFLFTPGGTINYASSSDSVTYAALPTDGTHAVDRNGVIVVASPRNFAGSTGQVNVPPPVQAGPMDVDQNGKVDALTDGLLMLRYFFGLRGAALINGAIANGAARNTAAAIEAYLGTCVAMTGLSC